MADHRTHQLSPIQDPAWRRLLSGLRRVQADRVLRLGLCYGLLSAAAAVGYALISTGLGLAFKSVLSPDHPLLTGLVFFFLALAILPLREQTENLIDQVFYKGKRANQARLRSFSDRITRAVDLPEILAVLRQHVEETLAPARLHLFVYDPLNDQYSAAPASGSQPTTDLSFSASTALAAWFVNQRKYLVLDPGSSVPAFLEPDRPRLALLGAQVFIPLPGRQRLSGWLALGPRLSGERYTAQQLSFVESLCGQAALAVERALVVSNLETRVREMNVLTRVSQGINITLSLDDILELIYAQTTQVIPAQHFQIMLYDRELEQFQYAFYLENDERITERENRPVSSGQALEQEVIRLARPILADDYNRECQQRGIPATRPAALAWMGVPLNAGADTIGALSLASSDPGTGFTTEQQALLQAIADQAAGALVKARLLQETERRARQLATLNNVTRQLTSTLETEPLLQSILENAAEILNCEAGSLLMLDKQTDELVFRVVIGPVAQDLINSRMPADRGVVGKAVKTCQSIIVNDVTRFPDWFRQTDEATGFVTRALLVIPLIVKNDLIGVIEVVNKRDGTLFTRDDVELLSAFASQAAVAIENARLYTLTDQALAARVEELSIMQRIDRELNTSLDANTAMHITLTWAMRQSSAAAGLVGVLQDGSPLAVRVTASQGYHQELEAYPDSLLPAADLFLQETIESGQPVSREVGVGDGSVRPLLVGGLSQAVFPIRREMNTIGLLLLEWTEAAALPEDMVNFLVRLSDHASIAISNAQLYSAVQQANLAKSDFVSFVAHELKNPMTSVKGYTELIAAGQVGPVTDMQGSFLATIRHNIERMNTLISDLNDMSKIEVGRLRLDFKSTALPDIIEAVTRSTRKQIEEKQQVLSIHLPHDLPALWADRMRVEQVIVNLVSNAHKYTPTGGAIEVGAECCPNRWDPNGAANVVHIWVKDNGIGIAEQDQKKIFQKFFRADDPKTREAPGTGLGLNITRSLVEMQGGRIWFESEFRKGTAFHFTVPVTES